MAEIIQVEWCTFCGATEAEGRLTVDMGDDGMDDFPSCKKCAIQLSEGYEVEGL